MRRAARLVRRTLFLGLARRCRCRELPAGQRAAAGFVGPTLPPLFCTSQAQIDQACLIVASFCGQTCTLVPGAAYVPATGLFNLVGRESQSGCDGSLCDGPFDYFTQRGDLRLTEAAAEVPALPAPGADLARRRLRG